jgi:hypothetical protein
MFLRFVCQPLHRPLAKASPGLSGQARETPWKVAAKWMDNFSTLLAIAEKLSLVAACSNGFEPWC